LGRRFGLLFSAGLLSDIGGFSTHTALLLHVYHLTDENAAFMGLMALANLLPFALGSPLGGVWAEKYDRKWVMIGCDVVRIPLILGMVVFTQNVWLLLVLQAMSSTATAIFMPSRNSIIPELVEKEKLHLANTANAGVMSFVHVAGPVIGAAVYAKTQTLVWIALFDAMTYVCSAGLLFLMAYHRVEVKDASLGGGMLRELASGFVYVRKERDLMQILLIFVTTGFAIGLLIPLIRPFIKEVLHGGDSTYAWLVGAFGVGGMIAPAVGYWAGRKLGQGRVIAGVFAIEATLMMIWSQVNLVWLSCLILFVWGVAVFTMFPCYMSYLHTYAKKEFMGRTFGLMDQATFMMQTVAAGIILWIGDEVAAQRILTVAAAGYFVLMLFMQTRSGMRLLRSRRGHSHPAEIASAASALTP
jgi:MFS family permease